MRQAASRREALWSQSDRSSIERWQETCQYYRDYLWDEVIGRCPPPSVPTNPRTRLAYDEPGFKGYEVVLDVWEEAFAYGILLVPKGIGPDERRPVVVCQHGLEGRSQDVVDPRIESPYNAYGADLANQGFVVYAPQNAYIGQDAFRVIQRKANPVKWSLFSLIARQHERTLAWLGEQPFVDAERIRILRTLLRWQDRYAPFLRCSTVMRCLSARRISTNGSSKMRHTILATAICSPASMRCQSSISATLSTMRRWRG